jgi:hypothetical protein
VGQRAPLRRQMRRRPAGKRCRGLRWRGAHGSAASCVQGPFRLSAARVQHEPPRGVRSTQHVRLLKQALPVLSDTLPLPCLSKPSSNASAVADAAATTQQRSDPNAMHACTAVACVHAWSHTPCGTARSARARARLCGVCVVHVCCTSNVGLGTGGGGGGAGEGGGGLTWLSYNTVGLGLRRAFFDMTGFRHRPRRTSAVPRCWPNQVGRTVQVGLPLSRACQAGPNKARAVPLAWFHLHGPTCNSPTFTALAPLHSPACSFTLAWATKGPESPP